MWSIDQIKVLILLAFVYLKVFKSKLKYCVLVIGSFNLGDHLNGDCCHERRHLKQVEATFGDGHILGRGYVKTWQSKYFD